MTNTTPFPKQFDVLDKVRASASHRFRLSDGSVRRKRIMVQAPTGFGMTLVGAMIAESALEKGGRVAFGVPSIDLIDQTVTRFYNEGLHDVGVIQASHHMTNYGRPLQICSPQTLSRRTMPDVTVVLVDEAHERFRVYEEWMAERPDILFIGLSATPWTKGLGKIYDELVIGATTKELMREINPKTNKPFLCGTKVYVPSVANVKDVATRMGDYSIGDLARVANQDALVGDVVENWRENGPGEKTLCFCVDRAHARLLTRRFKSAGIECAYVDGETSANERDAIRMKFAAGIVQVVCNIGVLTTGIDWDVRCIILARPTRSEILFVQMIGRGLRPADGKDYVLIFDHSDSHFRLGFVQDIHHDSLDMGEPRKLRDVPTEKRPRKCPKCEVLLEPEDDACPECGWHPPKHELPVEEVEGSLEIRDKITKEMRPKKTKEMREADKVVFYAELLGYAIDKEYSTGWAFHVYQERFKSKPEFGRRVEALPPGRATLRWIRYRNIKYAKSKKKRDER